MPYFRKNEIKKEDDIRPSMGRKTSSAIPPKLIDYNPLHFHLYAMQRTVLLTCKGFSSVGSGVLLLMTDIAVFPAPTALCECDCHDTISIAAFIFYFFVIPQF